jgi:hypothetical protein
MALLPGSPARGAGLPVAGVATDQRGVARDTIAPDLGAYEFDPAATGGPAAVEVFVRELYVAVGVLGSDEFYASAGRNP